MACFTHGPTIPCAKPRVLLTTQPKLVFPCAKSPLLLTVLTKTVSPCVKTPLLLTANWLRV